MNKPKYTMRGIAWSSKELIAQYNDLSSGYFFEPDTMRFFKSRITEQYRRMDDKTAYFITTERGPSGERKATVRRAVLIDYERKTDGRLCQKIVIDTVGEFNTLSLAQAKRAMTKL